MKKDLAVILGLFTLIIGIVVFAGPFSITNIFNENAAITGQGEQTNQKPKENTTVSAGTLSVNADIAATPEARKKGLSGRESLEINRGMLFVFETSGNYPIWMKGMRFPIDVIWIDENKKIVYIAPSALPEPGKKDSELVIYKPSANAKYVLEINAGLASANNLQVGDSVNFEL